MESTRTRVTPSGHGSARVEVHQTTPDRVLQQVAKSIAPAAMGVLMAATSLLSVFWVLGGLSLASVGILAVLLTRWRSSDPGDSRSYAKGGGVGDQLLG